MTVLSDKWIKKAAKKGMIKPFVNKQVRKGKILAKNEMIGKTHQLIIKRTFFFQP